MHEHVLEIIGLGQLVLYCGKPSKALLENIYSQRVHAINKDIDPQIEFKSVNQERLCYVPLGNQVLQRIEVLGGPSEENASALRLALRL